VNRAIKKEKINPKINHFHPNNIDGSIKIKLTTV